MGSAVAQFSHDDIDPSSIQTPTFGHDEIDSSSVQAPSKSSMAQTALEHFGKGVTLGYLPQIQAGVEAAGNAIGNAKDKAFDLVGLDQLTSIDNQLRKKGFKLPEETYTAIRDADIKRQAQQAQDNPATAKVADVAGGLTTGIAAGGAVPIAAAGAGWLARLGQGAYQGAKTGAIYGALSNPGDTAGEISPLQLQDRAVNAGKGAAFGGVVGGAALLVSGAVSAGASKLSNNLRDFAEDTAVNATGATGKQASNFQDGAGRELLNRGIVRFGDSQAKISQRAADAVNQANQQIDQSLSKLDAQGVKVDANTVYNTVRNTIDQMKADPSKADIARNLDSELDNIIGATDAKNGTQFGMQEAEAIKRGYGRKAGNWADPEKGMAGKELYQTWRGAVEDAAQSADPSTAASFQEGKKSYALLAPIQEAAERRAATTNQHQAGGFLDMAGTIAGEAAGGAGGAVAVPIARRIIAPRIASTLATSADAAANVIGRVPDYLTPNTAQPAAVQGAVSRLSVPPQNTPMSLPAAASSDPQKGPGKWMNDGLQNLKLHATEEERDMLDRHKGAMMVDPKTKNLLISASSFSPGSKPLDQIMEHLKTRLDEDK